MREIKFRVWDRWLNKMAYSFDIPSDYTEKNGELDLLNMFQSLSRRYIFMQYTGLKDKNGKEIYEGDIVRHVGEFCRNNVYSGVVGFESGYWKIKWFGNIKHQWRNDLNFFDSENLDNLIAITGNIYENQELLESEANNEGN